MFLCLILSLVPILGNVHFEIIYPLFYYVVRVRFLIIIMIFYCYLFLFICFGGLQAHVLLKA